MSNNVVSVRLPFAYREKKLQLNLCGVYARNQLYTIKKFIEFDRFQVFTAVNGLLLKQKF
jgi:hypothetical protein